MQLHGRPEYDGVLVLFRCSISNWQSFSFSSSSIALSLSETYALKYWWCSPPRTGIASVRPTVWTARGIGASLCSDRCVRASLYMVSIGPQGHHDHPSRDPRTLATSRLLPVLAVEIPLPW